MTSDKSPKKYKICLITPGHISTNPRLIKEAGTLSRSGYQVHLIFTQYLRHCSLVDKQLLAANPDWTFSCLNWELNSNFKAKTTRYFSGLKNKVGKYLFKRYEKASHVAVNRNFGWQLNAAIAVKAHLYIGHNLAALPVAFEAARRTGAKCGFDAEDFHRFEESDDTTDLGVTLKTHIENKFIPGLDYLTAASPLIGREYERIYHRPVTSVLNLFPKYNIPEPKRKDPAEPTKLFWFSQWIGQGRGIEEIIRAIGLLKRYKVELHLLGEMFESDRIYFERLIRENLSENHIVRFYSPIHPDDIIPFASQFDIGMASEISKPFNRDICLTNKIFTYIQSGLAIMASNTSAQAEFMKQFPSLGRVYKKGDHSDLAEGIKLFIEDPKALFQARNHAYRTNNTRLNWEIEQEKFLSIVHSIFPKKANEI